jgi:acetolactate decarboxylase
VPNISVVVPGFLDTAIKQAAAARGSSVESIVNAALGQYFQTTRHRLYQISTAAALVQGVFGGAVSSRTLPAHGDFGLGTFEHLNGEMVVLNGGIYQIHGDARVQQRPDDFLVPFAVVSVFQEEDVFSATKVGSLAELEQACNPHSESDNLFYEFRVDGVFTRMHVRVMLATAEGADLVQAAASQPEFHFDDIEGTLVCIWSPQ